LSWLPESGVLPAMIWDSLNRACAMAFFSTSTLAVTAVPAGLGRWID
jgi:hypothetical protein